MAARDFVGFLKAAGQRYWQVLPLSPTGYGDSPVVVYRNMHRIAKAGAHGMTVDDSTGIRGYERMFARRIRPRPMLPHDEWLSGIRGCFGPLASHMEADHVKAMQTPEAIQAENVYILNTWDTHAKRANALKAVRGSVVNQLQRLGGPVHPQQLGYSKEDLYSAILYAKDVRPRYTLLNAMDNFGVLKQIAREVADVYYPER